METNKIGAIEIPIRQAKMKNLFIIIAMLSVSSVIATSSKGVYKLDYN